MSSEEQAGFVKVLHSTKFMVDKNPTTWNVQDILRYNDKANIQMQMLSYIPTNLEQLKKANDYGISITQEYPARFGLLAALPTDSVDACLSEMVRLDSLGQGPDGFAVTSVYNGVYLSDRRLEPVWRILNEKAAVVHIHPSAHFPPVLDQPLALLDITFDTARVVVDMLYKGIFRRYPGIRFVLGHCGGPLPALSGRLQLLGTEEWVLNPLHINKNEIETHLQQLYLDTAATAKTGLIAGVEMVGVEHCIYGADCGVPCSTASTMDENIIDTLSFEDKHQIPLNTIGRNGWKLFPNALKRVQSALVHEDVN
jgi:predicted TIM-barrel fold metal-dependent hydrolase